MKKDSINKEIIIKSIIKMISDNNAVRSYMKGETTINTLTEKGIKLAKPL